MTRTRMRPGRPTYDENPPQLDHESQHAGFFALGDRVIRIDGSVLICEDDPETMALRDPLERLLTRINVKRLPIYDPHLGQVVPFTDALIYCEQNVPRMPTGMRPRRYTNRQGFDNRMSLTVLESLLAQMPGRTIQELTVDLYPNGTGTPVSREPTLRAALRRLDLKGRLRIERDPETGKKRYYAPHKSGVSQSPHDQRCALLGLIIATHLGGEARDHGSLVQALIETIEFNRGRVDDLWRDPRGQLKTEYEQLPAWDEHLPPEKTDEPF